MKEYIERELVNDLLNSYLDKWWGPEYYATSIIKDEIDEAPSADVVEVKHGHWINTSPYIASNGNYCKAQECSVCHALFVSPGNTPYANHPYCCECGAKMDGGKV